jgi:hypothetical protein
VDAEASGSGEVGDRVLKWNENHDPGQARKTRHGAVWPNELFAIHRTLLSAARAALVDTPETLTCPLGISPRRIRETRLRESMLLGLIVAELGAAGYIDYGRLGSIQDSLSLGRPGDASDRAWLDAALAQLED